MPNRSYEKGVRAEYVVRDALKDAGWFVLRAYASKGPCDLLAIHEDRDPVMVQVKAGFGRMGPAERLGLWIASTRYGAEAIYAAYDMGHISWRRLLGPHLGDMDTWEP